MLALITYAAVAVGYAFLAAFAVWALWPKAKPAKPEPTPMNIKRLTGR